MSTLSDLLRVRAPRNDYLRIAILLSLAIHAAVLTIHFTSPPAPKPKVTMLEVTLVNARSAAAPLQPVMLAQQQLNGGGEAETGQAASPLPRNAEDTPDDIVLEALRKRQTQLEEEQQRLYTKLLDRQKVKPERRTPDQADTSADAGFDDLDQESIILSAQISALKDRIERYNARPRRQFTGPSTKAVDYAEYVEAWRQKIELLGTEHYPAEARGKVYGSLQLTVHIRKDGTLDRIDIDRPSSEPILNLAAARIVQLAAPFAPLPPSIAAQTDILAITRTWNFVNQQLETRQP
ncbi:MAG TPA: TonB family protein [Burkholderiaceae bacterium]|nr:TonB family protein [Burkholderiaceae bacterium]